jgi:hypothetical protein
MSIPRDGVSKTMTHRLLIKREDELDVRELPGDEVFVYDRQQMVTHHLSPEIALVWDSCDGRNVVSDLEQILRSELKVPNARVIVRRAITRLDRLNLLQH